MTTAAPQVETLAIPLGTLSEAGIFLNFGGGELLIGPAEQNLLVSGRFEGGVLDRSPRRGTIELEPRLPAGPLLLWRPLRWDVGITARIPVDLRLRTGGDRANVDLSALRIRRLDIDTGASETFVRLPVSGVTTVRVSSGLASVELEVPPGMAARIRGSMALGSLVVDEGRFPRAPEGWASPEFHTARDRADIRIDGAFGSVRVG